MKKTLTEKRVSRAKQVGEALAVFREKHGLSFEQVELALYNAGHQVSLSTLKRLVLGTHVAHATTLAAIEAFLNNVGAPARIKAYRARTADGKKPRRGAWASGSR
jgi:hypothetical protein